MVTFCGVISRKVNPLENQIKEEAWFWAVTDVNGVDLLKFIQNCVVLSKKNCRKGTVLWSYSDKVESDKRALKLLSLVKMHVLQQLTLRTINI